MFDFCDIPHQYDLSEFDCSLRNPDLTCSLDGEPCSWIHRILPLLEDQSDG